MQRLNQKDFNSLKDMLCKKIAKTKESISELRPNNKEQQEPDCLEDYKQSKKDIEFKLKIHEESYKTINRQLNDLIHDKTHYEIIDKLNKELKLINQPFFQDPSHPLEQFQQDMDLWKSIRQKEKTILNQSLNDLIQTRTRIILNYQQHLNSLSLDIAQLKAQLEIEVENIKYYQGALDQHDQDLKSLESLYTKFESLEKLLENEQHDELMQTIQKDDALLQLVNEYRNSSNSSNSSNNNDEKSNQHYSPQTNLFPPPQQEQEQNSNISEEEQQPPKDDIKPANS